MYLGVAVAVAVAAAVAVAVAVAVFVECNDSCLYNKWILYVMSVMFVNYID